MISEAAGLVANAVDLFQIGEFVMNKLHNPWRNGALYECIDKLEKAGVQRPAALDLIQEILDTVEGIEREDARLEACRKASEVMKR
jgi:hypothetical protein